MFFCYNVGSKSGLLNSPYACALKVVAPATEVSVISSSFILIEYIFVVVFHDDIDIIKKDHKNVFHITFNFLLKSFHPDFGWILDEIMPCDWLKSAEIVNIVCWRRDGLSDFCFIFTVIAEDAARIEVFIGRMNDAIQCNAKTWKPKKNSDNHWVDFRTFGGY